MSQHIRVADKLKRQSAEQLVTMAGAVISGLTGNPAFPASTVDLKAVQAAADVLKTALVEQAQGGTAATADKNNKQEALIVLLRKVKHYVEDNCAGDPAGVLTSGFQPAIINRVRAPLGNPSILNVGLGNSTELVLKITPNLIGITGVNWDELAQSPWAAWQEKAQRSRVVTQKVGKKYKKVTQYFTVEQWHQAYFENEKSLGIKMELAKQAQLGGVGFCALGYEGKTDLIKNLKSKL